MTPRRARRSSPLHLYGAPRGPAGAGRPGAPLALLLAVLFAVCAGAAACGGSSGASASPSASPSATSTAGTAPLAGGLRAVAAAYWRLIDAGDYAAVAAAGVPGEPPSATAATSGIAHARLVRAKPLSSSASTPGSALMQVDVFIDPATDSTNPTPWGDAGEHQLFMHLEKASQGGWLVKSWGTGP
jgi:hypothetical protein